jgi:hypothetical protein
MVPDQGQLPQPAPGPQLSPQAVGQVTLPKQLVLAQPTLQAQLVAQSMSPTQESGPQLTSQRPGPQVIDPVQALAVQITEQGAATAQSMSPLQALSPHQTPQGPLPQVMSPAQAARPSQWITQLLACEQSIFPRHATSPQTTSQGPPVGQVTSSVQLPTPAQLIMQTPAWQPPLQTLGQPVASLKPSPTSGQPSPASDWAASVREASRCPDEVNARTQPPRASGSNAARITYRMGREHSPICRR